MRFTRFIELLIIAIFCTSVLHIAVDYIEIKTERSSR